MRKIIVDDAWMYNDIFDNNGFYITFDWSPELRDLYEKNPEIRLRLVVEVKTETESDDDSV